MSLPLAGLIEQIVQTHHVYCKQEAPRLAALLKAAVEQHAREYPELKRIQALFTRMSSDLAMHLVKEEQTLFPYIARVEQAVEQKLPVSWPAFGSVENPIRMMVQEHDQTGGELQEIRKLTGGYVLPPAAPELCVTLYAGLRAFEQDMQDHIRNEDQSLFPRAVAMEDEACRRSY